MSRNVRIWDWARVNAWLRQRLGLGDDHETPTAQEVARMNEYLRFSEHQRMAKDLGFRPAADAQVHARVHAVRPIRWANAGGDRRLVAHDPDKALEVQPLAASV